MARSPSDTPEKRFTTLLAASALGVYLLVVAGATAALADAVAACGSWPLCRGDLFWNVDLLVAWGHRILAALVGLSLLGTAILAYRRDVDSRTGALLGVALVGYPIQIAIGATVAISGASGMTSPLHLAVGVGIFSSLVVALAWELAATSPTDETSGDAHALTTEPATLDDADAVDPTATSVDESPTAASDGPRSTGLVDVLRAYVTLTKPRLMWLLCLVAGAGMALAAGATGAVLDVRTVLLTLGGGVLAIGASGTFNHVLERDLDRRMNRTADRPLAVDVVSVRSAIVFGLALAAVSLALFAQVNLLAAGLGLTAIGFYSVVYTLVLKPNTDQNTVIGGAAGALPALIGWAAVTGSVGVPGLALAALVFAWTPAHFYNLALAYRDDYARGGFPMLPVVRGAVTTRKHVVYYLGATLVVAVLLAAVAPLGGLYALTTAALGAVFLWAVVAMHRDRSDAAAMRAFHASNVFLGGVLLVVVLDSLAL